MGSLIASVGVILKHLPAGKRERESFENIAAVWTRSCKNILHLEIYVKIIPNKINHILLN